MVITLALGSAVVFGAADFLGGAASRRCSAVAVLLVSTPVGLAVTLLAALALPGSADAAALGWGALAGVCGGTGFGVFYAALAAGPMSVVAPVSALASALLPLAVAAALGERPPPAVLAGAALCLAAIVLVSAEPGGERTRGPGHGALLALGSGLCFGLFFVLIRNAGAESGLWPLVTARAAGMAVVLAAAVALGTRPARGRAVLGLAVAAGVLDSAANALYLAATRAGMLSLAAVLTSLYPAVTVLLARIVYGELLRGVQRLGLVLAAVGVTLVTVD